MKKDKKDIFEEIDYLKELVNCLYSKEVSSMAVRMLIRQHAINILKRIIVFEIFGTDEKKICVSCRKEYYTGHFKNKGKVFVCNSCYSKFKKMVKK